MGTSFGSVLTRRTTREALRRRCHLTSHCAGDDAWATAVVCLVVTLGANVAQA